jgi:hypothetical protein
MERTYTLLADNTEKDLRRAMRTGKTFSCNNSPTCQAKIKDIVGGYCVYKHRAVPMLVHLRPYVYIVYGSNNNNSNERYNHIQHTTYNDSIDSILYIQGLNN